MKWSQWWLIAIAFLYPEIVTAGSFRMVAVTGPAPGLQGYSIVGFRQADASDSGLVNFMSAVGSEGDVTLRDTIYAEAGVGEVRYVARQGDMIPTLGYRYVPDTSIYQLGAPNGDIYFLSGVEEPTNDRTRVEAVFRYTRSAGLSAVVIAHPAEDLEVPALSQHSNSEFSGDFVANSMGDLASVITNEGLMAFNVNGAAMKIDAVTRSPTIDAVGNIAYREGELGRRQIRVWDKATGTSRIVARDSAVVPGLPNFGFRVLAHGEKWVGIDDGRARFIGGLYGHTITEANDFGLWGESSPGGRLELIAREGDHAPGTPEGVVWSDWRITNTPVLFGRSGGIGVGLSLTGPGVDPTNDFGFWAGDDQDLHLVVREGMPVPGDEPGAVLDAPTHRAVTQDGRGIFQAYVLGDTDPRRAQGIWGEDVNGDLIEIVRKGDQLTLPDGTHTTFNSVFLMQGVSESGYVPFIGRLSSGQTGLFVSRAIVVPEPITNFSVLLTVFIAARFAFGRKTVRSDYSA